MLNSTFKQKIIDLRSSIEELATDYEHASSAPEKKPFSGYLSTKQAAEFLGVTSRSLFNYRQSGLKFYQIGRKLLFDETDLIVFVNKFGVIR